MSKDTYENLLEELKHAITEYITWKTRSQLPPSLTPIDKEKEKIVITPELWDQLEKNKQRAEEAEERFHKALEALANWKQ